MAEGLNLYLKIEGMHCSACVRRVAMALRKVPGVEPLAVEVGSARVQMDPSQAGPEQVKKAVDDAGFTATIAS